jgi:hypothetical protein
MHTAQPRITDNPASQRDCEDDGATHFMAAPTDADRAVAASLGISVAQLLAIRDAFDFATRNMGPRHDPDTDEDYHYDPFWRSGSDLPGEDAA